jgi:hypothetical protein
MSVDYFGITLNAVFTGMGIAIGTPIGQWVWGKFKEHKNKVQLPKDIDRAWDNLQTKEMKGGIKNGK